MKSGVISLIGVIISIVGVIFLVFGVNDYKSKQNDNTSYFREYADSVADLEQQKRTLQSDINKLVSAADEKNIDGTVSLLMCDMGEEIYNDIFPITEAAGVKCTLVVTADSLPDSNGKLTSAQVAELMAAGWKIIPGFTAGDGDNGITEAYNWILDNGYNAGGTVYINSADATDDIMTLLSLGGFPNVIIDRGNGTVSDVYTDEIGEVWFPSVIGYNSTGPKNILNEAISKGGNLIFNVGGNEDWEIFNPDKFTSMLNYMTENQAEGMLVITDIVSAKNYTVEARKNASSLKAELDSKVSVIEAQIDEIDQKINSLYNEYKK